jgi:ApeA N-terminal domain 1
METLEVAGNWWIPGRLDHKVPGILTFDLKKAGRLRLIGGQRLADHLPDAAGNNGRIHGECVGRSFTLDGCFQQNRGLDEEVIYVNHVYDPTFISFAARGVEDAFG